MSKIIKLSNGNYRIQVYDKYGTRHRLIFNKKYEAEAYIRKIETEKNDDKLVRAKIYLARVTFEKAYEDFWAGKLMLAPKSVQKYNAIIKQIDKFRISQGLEYIDEFDRHHADLFKTLLVESSAAAKTINTYIMCLKAIFIEQINRDNIVHNPTGHLKSVPKPSKTLLQREEEYYSEDEIKKFFNQKIDPVYKTALLGLFLTGMRFEELANLTWEFVDLEQRMIKIRTRKEFQTKTPSSERDIPISNFLFGEIKKLVPKEKTSFVFHSKFNSKLSERTLLTVCKRIAENAGISKTATLHKFRHTFTSLLSQMGVSLEVREYLLGHRPQLMTLHYTKLDPRKYHGEVSLLDNLIRRGNDDKRIK